MISTWRIRPQFIIPHYRYLGVRHGSGDLDIIRRRRDPGRGCVHRGGVHYRSGVHHRRSNPGLRDQSARLSDSGIGTAPTYYEACVTSTYFPTEYVSKLLGCQTRNTDGIDDGYDANRSGVSDTRAMRRIIAARVIK